MISPRALQLLLVVSPLARLVRTVPLSNILNPDDIGTENGGWDWTRTSSINGGKGLSIHNPSYWGYLGVAAILVVGGGIFAGLTLALMGQDEVHLQVIEASGDDREKKTATAVLRLLAKGKHWVLVTLLLSNVITNETLPIVLDRALGCGWQAVLGSTVLIVIFGEILPQSICVRYGLTIGAWMAPCVLVLMYILSPVAWPTACLLDKFLGKEHGTVYKKSGLKCLVNLHQSLAAAGSEQLSADEVTIISAALDLKDKTVGSVMTPMEKVFTLSTESVLDEPTMNVILSQGYSRIPIYEPGNNTQFVGMLLVKTLIIHNSQRHQRVKEFPITTLPETRPETSCLDIVNFFQEGKSHMALVSEHPGEDSGAIGIVTLEDVIEELIGEEIVDESDNYIDAQKAVRRISRPTKMGRPKVLVIPDSSADGEQIEEGSDESQDLISMADGDRDENRDENLKKDRNGDRNENPNENPEDRGEN